MNCMQAKAPQISSQWSNLESNHEEDKALLTKIQWRSSPRGSSQRKVLHHSQIDATCNPDISPQKLHKVATELGPPAHQMRALDEASQTNSDMVPDELLSPGHIEIKSRSLSHVSLIQQEKSNRAEKEKGEKKRTKRGKRAKFHQGKKERNEMVIQEQRLEIDLSLTPEPSTLSRQVLLSCAQDDLNGAYSILDESTEASTPPRIRGHSKSGTITAPQETAGTMPMTSGNFDPVHPMFTSRGKTTPPPAPPSPPSSPLPSTPPPPPSPCPSFGDQQNLFLNEPETFGDDFSISPEQRTRAVISLLGSESLAPTPILRRSKRAAVAAPQDTQLLYVRAPIHAEGPPGVWTAVALCSVTAGMRIRL